jgi:hypothetical protein
MQSNGFLAICFVTCWLCRRNFHLPIKQSANFVIDIQKVVSQRRLIGRLSVIVLLFFSLQGEAIVRLVDAFGCKADLTSSIIRKGEKQQRLVKLQCFTKKLQVQTLPPQFGARIPKVLRPLIAVFSIEVSYPTYNSPYHLTSATRGPPSLA